MDSVVRGRKVVTPDGVRGASVHVRDGRIERVGAEDEPAAEGAEEIDAGDLVVMPGLVDTHVHVNEPGRTEWEGFETATQAAAAAGVTALVDMPLNCIPPTTTLVALEEKRASAAPHCWVDVGTWGGVVPGNTAELAPMHEAGVPGFKCFLLPSGVDEFPHVAESDLREAMPVLRDLGSTLLVHAELAGPIDAATRRLDCAPRAYGCYLSSRPAEAERRAVEMMARLCRDTGAPVHIVHLACADALPIIREAKDEGLPLTAETCPHYLTIDPEAVPDGATPYKCAPPIRERRHAEALWDALDEGLVSFVVTDHSPCPPPLKELDSGDFLEAWGGISSLELGLSVMWTTARDRGIPLERVVGWMARATAGFARLGDRKGALAPGCDADLVLFDPEATVDVEATRLHHRHPLTPYDGRSLRGAVRRTLLRGRTVYADGELLGPPRGELLGARAGASE